jgi:TPR repeat protein
MAAHYFPVTQYVVSHYGAVDTGVGMLEEVRLLDTSGHPQGFGGEEDLMHQFTEAEALGGDPAAQTWLGKRYFWGWGGLTPDEVAARGWFERAAAQGEPEALYNLGVFHELGQAGFPMDREKSFQYFLRAANAANPFHMALHAVGNHYRYHPVEANHSLAREYYLKAADRDSPEALFSLAMMHKDGVGGPVSVPHCVFYLRWGSSTGFRPLID